MRVSFLPHLLGCVMCLNHQSNAQNIFNQSGGDDTPNANQTVDPTANTTMAPSTNTTLTPDTNTTIPPDMNTTLAPTLGNNSNITTFAPIMAPTEAPVEAPIPGGPITRQRINVNFLVSNLENPKLVEPSAVNASGLQLAWPRFVAEVVSDTTAARTFTTGTIGEGGRRLRQTTGSHQQRRRRLVVNLEAGSEYIYDIVLMQCPMDMGPLHEDLTCHDVYGTYTLALQGNENPRLVEQEYGVATVTAIMDGKLEETMEEVDSDTPLFIGTVAPPGSDDDGMPVWLLVLIILICILICLCIMAAIFFFMNKDKQQNDDNNKAAAAGEPYEEDGFAYDFLIPPNQKPQTEVDDDDPGEAESRDAEEFRDEEIPVVKEMEETAIIEEEERDEDNGEEEEEDDEWDQPDEDVEEQDEFENDSGEDSPKPDPSEEFGEQDDPDGVRGSTGPQSGSDSDDDNLEESAEFETADELEGEPEGEDDWDDENPGEEEEEVDDDDWDDEDEDSKGA